MYIAGANALLWCICVRMEQTKMKTMIVAVAVVSVFGLCGTAHAEAVVPQDFVVTRNGDESFTLTPTGTLGEGEKWTVVWLSKEAVVKVGRTTDSIGIGPQGRSDDGEGDTRSLYEVETWLTEKVPVGTITAENAYGGDYCVRFDKDVTGSASFSGASYTLPAETDSLRVGRVSADGTSFLTLGAARHLYDMKSTETKGNELQIGRTIPVTYFNRRWDSAQKKIVEEEETAQARIMTRYTTVLEDGCWYVAGYRIRLADRLNVTGHANLILAEAMVFVDGLFVSSAKVEAPYGIDVPVGVHLSIYGQGSDTGSLHCGQGNGDAMIGGRSGLGCGTIDINGGRIDARRIDGENPGVGLGGGAGCTENNGTVNLFGGVVSTWGVGGGPNGVGCTINVYGGTVDSQRDDGAAFGAGTGSTEHGEFNVFDEKMKLILPLGDDENAYDDEEQKWVYHFTSLGDYRTARGSKLRLANFVTVRFPLPTEHLECTCVNQQSIFSSRTEYLSPDDAGGGWGSVTVEKDSNVSVKYVEKEGDEAWYLRGRHAHSWKRIMADVEVPALGPVAERPLITVQDFAVSRRADGKLSLEMPKGFSLAEGEELVWIAFNEATWKYLMVPFSGLNGRRFPICSCYQFLEVASQCGLKAGLLDPEGDGILVPEFRRLCVPATGAAKNQSGVAPSHYGVLSQLDGPMVLPADAVAILVCKTYNGSGGRSEELIGADCFTDADWRQYITIGGAKDLQSLSSGESRGNEFGKATEKLPYLQYDETVGRLVAQPARETIVITNGMTTLEDGQWYSLPIGQALHFGDFSDDCINRLTVNGHAHLIVHPFNGIFLSRGVEIAAGGTLSVHVQAAEDRVDDCALMLMLGTVGCTFGDHYDEVEGAGVAMGEGGAFNLHGCTVEVYGGNGCAGIEAAANGTVNVYRGTLKVHGNEGAAAIDSGCTVNIVGGNVYAYSGSEGVPAIGGQKLMAAEGSSFWAKAATDPESLEPGEWQEAEPSECFGESGASTVRIVNPIVVKYPDNDYFGCEVLDIGDDELIGSEPKDGSVEMRIGESSVIVHASSDDPINYRIASTCIRPYFNPTNVIDTGRDFLFKPRQPAQFDISVTRNADGTFTLTPTGELENPEDKWVWVAYNWQNIERGAANWRGFELRLYRSVPSEKEADYYEPSADVNSVDSGHYGVSATGGSFILPSDTERVIVCKACFHPCEQNDHFRMNSVTTIFASETLGMAKNLQAMAVLSPEVKIVSAKSERPGGEWNGAAQVIYRLRGLSATNEYSLAFEMLAENQTAAKTNPVVNMADGVYTQEVSRTEFFGIESQVEDREAKLTLKLIEK